MKNPSCRTFTNRRIVALLLAPAAALGWVAASCWQRQAPKALPEQRQAARQKMEGAGVRDAGVRDLRSVAYRPAGAPLQKSLPKPLQGAAATAELTKRGQYASLMSAVNNAMYGFKPNGDKPSSSDAAKASGFHPTFRATNPAQDFAAHFDARGVWVQTTDGESLRLQWQSVGRDGATPQVIAPGQVALSGEELQVRREGATEWFRNNGSGLEQGFTLHQKPAGNGGEVRLTLAASGLHARNASNVKNQIHLLDDKGQTALTYSKLKVWDADGKILPARMEAKDGRILLAMRDQGAHYPLTVDPLLASQQAYLKASNTDPGDDFGLTVAIDGDTVAVGAVLEDSNATGVNGNQNDNSAANAGAVYVFVRNDNTWSQQAYLKASNTEADDYFGISTAISGDTIVVGALREDSGAIGVNGDESSNSSSNAGAAYVFVRSGGPSGTWSQQAYLKASNTGANDGFGWKIDVDGDTAIVAATSEASGTGNPNDNSAADAGAAYVFVRNGSTWSQQAYLKANYPEFFDQFGSAVAVSADTIVVGANAEDSDATGVNGDPTNNNAIAAGAAYVFVRNAGSWSLQAYLKALYTGSADNFGTSVAIDGETIVVGAPWEDSSTTGVDSNGSDNNASNAGAAYVFTRSGGLSGTWSKQAYLKASNTGSNDQFGWSVAVDGDTIVVGANGENSNATGVNGNQADSSASSAGAAYMFTRSSGIWSQQIYFKASNTGSNDQFGYSVALDGNTVVVGAYGESSNATGVDGDQSNNTAGSSGAAYIFKLDTAQSGPNFLVNNSDDTNDGSCTVQHCSLREAINAANVSVDASTITFDATVFATAQTVNLNSALSALSTNITINGPAAGVTVRRNSAGNYRILKVASGQTVALSKLTLTNGSDQIEGGGGLYNEGTVTLTDCTISGNTSTNAGGGLENNGTAMTLRGCTISGNTCTTTTGFTSGGIDNFAGTLSLFNCTVANNQVSAGSNGNGGGGLWNLTTATIINCTFTGNSAGGSNSAGGIHVDGGSVTVGNSIIAANTGSGGATPDVFGAFTSSGHNLIGDATGGNGFTASGDQTGTTATPLDAKLDALDNNGGLTQTVALLTGSPAINAGNTALLPPDTSDADGDSDSGESYPFDQREVGFPRIQGTTVDIGAYELPILTVAPASVTEGNAGTTTLVFTVTLSSAAGTDVTFIYQTANGSPAATAGTDYVAILPTTRTIPAGQSSTTINVTVNGDTLNEVNERITLQLSAPTNATIGSMSQGTILDDDAAPSISINDVSVNETNGGSGQAQFTLTLSAASAQTVTVLANTNSGGGSPTATPGTDYTAQTNTAITFAPGQTTRPFNVTILGDIIDENDERFGVTLSGAVNATISDNTGVGTILDNDNPPTVSVSAPNVTEGNTGDRPTMTFTLSLSAASARNISVQYQTANSTTFPATSGTDYTAVPLTTVIFNAGQTTKTVNVTIKGDTLDEDNERVRLNLTNPVNATRGTISEGIIVDDDATPGLSINDLSINEGNSGTKLMLFTVTLSAASGRTVTVNAATGNGGTPAATAGSDHVALASTPITFTSGQTSKQVSVTINGDTTVEPNEKFGVILSGAVNATLADNSGIGTILNDDAAGAAPSTAPSGDEDAG